MTEASRNQSSSLRRALAVLDHVRDHGEVSLSRLAEDLRLGKSTVGALSVSSLTSRLTPTRVRDVGPMVAQAGQEILHVLGSTRGRAAERGTG